MGATIFGDAAEELISVTTSTLDAKVTQFRATDVIKIDIEGGEYDALTGGTALLENKLAIIVSEINSWLQTCDADGTRAARVARFSRNYDYRLWNMDSGVEVESETLPRMVLAMPNSTHAATSEGQTPSIFELVAPTSSMQAA